MLRNNIVHGDGKASVSASVHYLINYQSTFAAATGGDPTNSIDPPTWKLPAEGTIKANVDAGWDSTSKQEALAS